VNNPRWSPPCGRYYLLSRTITYGAALYLLASVLHHRLPRRMPGRFLARRRSYERASLISILRCTDRRSIGMLSRRER
jgi:hypothetical protein